MTHLALLTHESANRVFARDAPRLLAAEVAAHAPAFEAAVSEVEVREWGGVPYVSMATSELTDGDLETVSGLAGVRAAFERTGEGGDLRLRPLDLVRRDRFDDDLVTIQRYNGKTNEQLTHLLVNLTAVASPAVRRRRAAGQEVRLLDPVAGRGGTLNRALLLGFRATGIEVDATDVDQYRGFLVTYLKEHRVKHRLHRERVKKGPLAGTGRWSVELGDGGGVEVVHGDTTDAARLLPGRRVDLVVGDLPYGVQHRAGARGARSRSPEELVAEALPGWTSLLVPGGAAGFAWNTRTLPRPRLEELLADHGLELVHHPSSFAHVVDRSITRDLVVAVRPPRGSDANHR